MQRNGKVFRAANLSGIYTDAARDVINNYSMNAVLGVHRQIIKNLRTSAAYTNQGTLAQLRSGCCSGLSSYWARIGEDV